MGGAKGSSVLQARSSSLRLFRNFQPYLYWSGTAYPVVGKSSWSFSFGNGFQGTNLNANAMYAIPLFPETGGNSTAAPANEGIGVVPHVNTRPSLVPSADGRTIYDRALNVTWVADANLAATEKFGVKGVNPNGSMSWHTSQNWIAAMNVAHYLGRSDWRLPKTLQPDDSCSIITPKLKQGSGYNCTRSEMGELFYTELGSQAGSSLERTHNRYMDLFHNFQQYLYWSEADPEQSRVGAWTFSFGNGFQGTNFFSNDIYAIPVVYGPIEKH